MQSSRRIQVFATGVSLSATNTLRLVIIASGLPPAFSSGFSCTVTLNGTAIAGFDRASFALGFNRSVVINRDLGVYYTASRKLQPSSLFVKVVNPPSGGNVHLDIQQQIVGGGSWSSILPTGAPLTITAGLSSVISTTTFNPSVTIQPGTLLRPYFLSGPSFSGMGYNISLELEVIS
jgi:hypothetical protein